MSLHTEINGKIPAGVEEWIVQLRDVEVALGNIPKPQAWESKLLDAFVQESMGGERPLSDAVADHLFLRISTALDRAGFSATQTADLINATVLYKGGPKYCDASEVTEALETAWPKRTH